MPHPRLKPRLPRGAFQWANVAVAATLLVLPYWLFDLKFFIGGDDSRLFYVYPKLWLENVAWFSWLNFSNVGQHNPEQFMAPLVAALSLLETFVPRLVLANLAFSSPLLLGFIFFQKMFHALAGEESRTANARWAAVLGGAFYVMSPILWVITVAPFLYTIWLVALFPIIGFCFMRYLERNRLSYLLYGALAGVLCSLGFWSVPWLMGAVIPLAAALALCAGLFRRGEVLDFLKKCCLFTLALVSTQAFWLLPFAMSMLDRSGSFARQALSSTTKSSFAPTVNATMLKNGVLFPLLNLFHRSIVFDFNWATKSAFEAVYDRFLALDVVFVGVALGAVLIGLRGPAQKSRRTFHVILVAWLLSLFLFTVNIGSLRSVFLMLGRVPGFAMFRNAYDKFAPGFVFLYATLFALSLWVVLNELARKSARLRAGLIALCAAALLVNAAPAKSLVNRPLWNTSNYTVIDIPEDYTAFLGEVKRLVPDTTNVLGVPFAFPAYSVIKDAESSDVYVGASPVKVLTGVNDFSGYLSFSDAEARRFEAAVLRRDLAEVRGFLKDHNIGYFFVTKNIPAEVMASYLFQTFPKQPDLNQALTRWLLPNLAGPRLAASASGAYELYGANVATSVLEAPGLTFRKISPVKYALRLDSARAEELVFKDSFNFGWRLYPEDAAEGAPSGSKLFAWKDLRYFWRTPAALEHRPGQGGISNVWSLRGLPAGETELTLFFYPQIYFYGGILVSIAAMLLLVLAAVRQGRRRRAPDEALPAGRA